MSPSRVTFTFKTRVFASTSAARLAAHAPQSAGRRASARINRRRFCGRFAISFDARRHILRAFLTVFAVKVSFLTAKSQRRRRGRKGLLLFEELIQPLDGAAQVRDGDRA